MFDFRTSNDKLLIDSYREPEWRDRQDDSPDGVMIYIKDSIYYRRQLDLEPNGIECFQIKMVLKQRMLCSSDLQGRIQKF